jgi:hypothetical protein
MPLTFLQVRDRRPRQGLQRLVLIQQLLPDFDGVSSFQSGSQQDGDEFGMAEGIGAERGESFARAFAGGLVFNA